MLRSVLFSFTLASLFASPQPQPIIKRDGSNWTLAEQGSLSVDPAGHVKMKAAGNIRVRGVSGAQFSYKLTRSIRARSESDARGMLGRFPVTSARQGSTALFEVAYGPFATNLEITVPRGLESL